MRREGPAGVMHLVGRHSYETMFEYIGRLHDHAKEWVAVWKLDFFQVVSVGPLLEIIDPTLLYVKRHPRIATVLIKKWDTGSRPHRLPAANDWDKAIEDIAGDEEEIDDFSEPEKDASAAEDGCVSAEDEAVSDPSEDGFGDADDYSGDSDVGPDDADGPPPPPPAAAEPEADELPAAIDAPAPLMVAEPEAAPPVAMEVEMPAGGPADPADPGPSRSRADLEMRVEGGVIRFYGAAQRIVGHCEHHGERECRFTRTTMGSTLASRAGQGRPLGLVLAWLRCGCRDDLPTAASHKAMRPMPSHADRLRAREEFAADPASEAWFAVERARREGDGSDEPDHVP